MYWIIGFIVFNAFVLAFNYGAGKQNKAYDKMTDEHFKQLENERSN